METLYEREDAENYGTEMWELQRGDAGNYGTEMLLRLQTYCTK